MPHTSIGQLSPSEVQSYWNLGVSNKSFPFRSEPRNGKVHYDTLYCGFHENNDKDMFFQKLDLLPSFPKRKRSSIFRNDFEASQVAPTPCPLPQLLKDGGARGNAFMFELTSILGKKLVQGWSAYKLDPISIDSSVSKYERFCDGAFIGGSSKLQYFRNRTECQFPVTYPNGKENGAGCHTYCFTRSQKLERRIVIRTGLSRRSRILKRLCRPLAVNLHQLKQAEIRKYISEKEALQLNLNSRKCAVRVRRLSAAECQNLIQGKQPSRPSFSLTGKEIEIDGKVVIDLCSDDESDDVVVMPKWSVLDENGRHSKTGSPRASCRNSVSIYDESSVSTLRDSLTTPVKLTTTKSLGISLSKSYKNPPISNGHSSTSTVNKKSRPCLVPRHQASLQDDNSLRKADEADTEINTQRKVSSRTYVDSSTRKAYLKNSTPESSSNRIPNFSNGIANGALSALTSVDSVDAITGDMDASHASKLPDTYHKQALPSGACNDSPVQKIKNKIAGMLRLTESNNGTLPLPQKVINYLKTRFAALASEELTILPLPADVNETYTPVGNGASNAGWSSNPDRSKTVPICGNSNHPSAFNKLHSQGNSVAKRKAPERTRVSKSNYHEAVGTATEHPQPAFSNNPYSVTVRSPISGVDANVPLSTVTYETSQIPSLLTSFRQRLRSSRDQQSSSSGGSVTEVNSSRACVTRSMSSSPKHSDVTNHQPVSKTRPASLRGQDMANSKLLLETRNLECHPPSREKPQPLLQTPSKDSTYPTKNQPHTPGRLSKGSPMTPQLKIGFKCHVCGFAKFFSHDSQSAINDHIISKHGGFEKVTLVRNARRPVDCILYNAFLTKNLSSLNSKQRKLKS